jgi:uncharacterized protein YutE (UPF0331/DUF86 family)
LEKLKECLGKLEPLREKSREDFDQQPYLKDIVERNLEVAIQCLIDMANRIISIEDAQRPKDYYEAFLMLGNIQVFPSDFAKKIAPIAGFRNILVHEYIGLDWDLVYDRLQRLEDFYQFEEYIKKWIRSAGV